MNCQRTQRFLSLYRDGHPAGAEEAAVAAHARDCPACRQFREALGTWGEKVRVAAESQPAPRSDVRGGALDRWIAQQNGAATNRRRWPLLVLPKPATSRLAWGAAVVTLLAAALSLARWQQARRTGVEGPTMVRNSTPASTAPFGPRVRQPLEGLHGNQVVKNDLGPVHGIRSQKAVVHRKKQTSFDGGNTIAIHDRPLAPQLPSPKRATEVPSQPGGPAPSVVPPLPDARYLDGRDPSLLAKWGTIDSKEQAQLQAILHKLPPPADDFVRIPFPRIAGAGGAGIAAAVHEYQQQAKVVDPRLFRKVTFADKGVALGDFCAELQTQTGVQFRASRSVADEKVTVFLEEKPARDVLRAVSRLFGYAWVRSSRDGEYRYELDQDLRLQLAEEERRTADIHAALLAVDEQAQAFRPYVEMSYDEFRKRWDQLPRSVQRSLGNVANGGWGAMLLYYRLTPRDRAALIAGQEVVFRPGDTDPDHRLSDDLNHQIVMQWRDVVGGPDHSVGVLPGAEVRQVRLKLDRTELGQVSLSERMTVAGGKEKTLDYRRYILPDWDLATGRSPSVAKPDNATANAALRGQAPFDQVVSLHPKPTCPQVRAAISGHVQQLPPGVREAPPHVFSADVWEAVHRTTGLPIVTDYYTRMFRLSAVTMDRKPLFDALCSIGDALGVRWKKDGDFITGRSTSYFWDKVKEVPNRYLQRWIHDRDTNGGLPLADRLEMSSLPDPELDSRLVGEAIEHCWGLPEWWSISNDRLRMNRRHARFLAILTPEQMTRALRPEGLPFRELTPAQQQASIQLNYEDAKTMEVQNGSADDPIRADMWPHCVIYIEYVPAGWYAWNPPASIFTGALAGPWNGPIHPIGGRTAAEALAAVRRIYPPASPQDVQLMKGGRFWAGFQY